ncbi:uncharacterized protein [Miscanthus floridulus]|uniref:uncharacterized protein n=1 Tax=Miscanthus floridulus TaxID=154761 RepID=UPI003457B6A8
MTTAPGRESPSARRTEDGPATTASIPGDGESLAHTTGASATATETTTKKVDTLVAETATVVDAPEAMDATPPTTEEQMSSPAGMLGVVGAAGRPRSPPVVPQATAEEDEVVEIEHAAPKPQSVWILRKRGEDVVVVEEEDTTREIKRLKTAVAGVMTQIEGIARTADQRHQLMKRMEPLAKENKILREALSLSEKSIQRAQCERDLAQLNSRDLEHQKEVLSKRLTAASEQLKKTSEQLATVSEELKNMSEQLGKKNGELKNKTEQLDRKCQQFEDVSKLKSDYRHKTKAQFDVLVQEAKV